MKTINNLINENFITETLNIVDENIILEKLQETHLIKLAKWLKQFSAKNSNDYFSNRLTFAGIFGRRMNIEWDKVTSSDFEVYEPGDKAGTKKAVSTQKSDGNNYLVLYLDNNDNILYALTWYGIQRIDQGKTTTDYAKVYDEERGYERTDYSKTIEVAKKPADGTERILQKEVREFCSKYKFMLLDLNKYSTNSKQADRRNSQYGIIRQEDYANIAKTNVKRYKEIVAQLKAEKIAKQDTISKDVQDTLNKVMDLSTKVMKGGAKYMDLEYEMSSLLEMCYGKTVYTGVYTHGRNGKEGKDGLLKVYADYLHANMSTLKNGKDYYGDASKHATKVTDLITKINSQIQKIENKM